MTTHVILYYQSQELLDVILYQQMGNGSGEQREADSGIGFDSDVVTAMTISGNH